MEGEGWITCIMQKTNKIPDKEFAPRTLGHRHLLEYLRVPPLRLPFAQVLTARASKYTWWASVLQKGIQLKKWRKEWHGGAQHWYKTHNFIFTISLYTPSCTWRNNGMCRVMQGQQSWLSLRPGFLFAYLPVYRNSQEVYIIFWPRGLLTFLWLSS